MSLGPWEPELWRLDGEDGPAERRTAFELERMVQLTLDAAPPLSRRRRSTWGWAAVAAVVLLGGPTAYGAWQIWEGSKSSAQSPSRVGAPVSAPSQPLPRDDGTSEDAPGQERAAQPAEEPEVEPKREVARPLAPSDAVRRSSPPPRVVTSAPRARRSASAEAEPTAPAERAPALRGWATTSEREPAPRAHESEAAPRRARDLLAEANRLRAGKQWRLAAETYARARKTAEGAEGRHVAAVSEAELRLGFLSDPGGALEAFEAALKAWPRGPLAPEARYGQGAALEALGRAEEAKRVWSSLARDLPRSTPGRKAATSLERLR